MKEFLETKTGIKVDDQVGPVLCQKSCFSFQHHFPNFILVSELVQQRIFYNGIKKPFQDDKVSAKVSVRTRIRRWQLTACTMDLTNRI